MLQRLAVVALSLALCQAGLPFQVVEVRPVRQANFLLQSVPQPGCQQSSAAATVHYAVLLVPKPQQAQPAPGPLMLLTRLVGTSGDSGFGRRRSTHHLHRWQRTAAYYPAWSHEHGNHCCGAQSHQCCLGHGPAPVWDVTFLKR